MTAHGLICTHSAAPDSSAKRSHPADLLWSIRGGCPPALSRGAAANTSPWARGHVMLRDQSLVFSHDLSAEKHRCEDDKKFPALPVDLMF